MAGTLSPREGRIAWAKRLGRSMDEHTAIQIGANVLLDSGYFVITNSAGRETADRLTPVMERVSEGWIVVQVHVSASPK